jgi:hypothetical protein
MGKYSSAAQAKRPGKRGYPNGIKKKVDIRVRLVTKRKTVSINI